MKKSFFLLLLASGSIVATAQNRSDQEPYLVKSLANETVKEVTSETSGGNISLTGTSGSDMRVEVYVRSNNNRGNKLSKSELQQRLTDDYELDVSVRNGLVTAKARPKRNNMDWKKALSISFKIYAPQAVSSELTTSGGNIDLTNLSGNQKFTTSGGNLQLDQISGRTRGATSGGNILVKNSKDDLNLTTSGGNIDAKDCSGTLNLSTSGGSLRLKNLNGDIEANTSGGNVQGSSIEGTLSAHTSGGNVDLEDLACTLDASTSGGHIDVAIKTLRNSVKISNSGGNINLTLPKGAAVDLDLRADRVKTETLQAFSGKVDDNEINGKLNGGGTSVRVNAGSGRVSLAFQ